MLLKNSIENIRDIVKKADILTDEAELYCYAEDSSNNHVSPKKPDAVVFAESIEDVRDVLRYAAKNKIPLIPRGAGTNMVGACTCPNGGIVLNFSRMNKILDFNPVNMTMKVQPGVILGDIKKLAEENGLFYPPDPSNFKVSTIGGSIAQSSGGACAFKYGTTNSAFSYTTANNINAYFVNDYAQTDEYEDRASTFEYLMSNSEAGCLKTGTTIWKKAKYICEQIDAVFKTVTPSVTEYWERYVYN